MEELRVSKEAKNVLDNFNLEVEYQLGKLKGFLRLMDIPNLDDEGVSDFAHVVQDLVDVAAKGIEVMFNEYYYAKEPEGPEGGDAR